MSRQHSALRHLCFLNIKFNDMIVPLFVSESWAHSKRYRDEEEYGRDWPGLKLMSWVKHKHNTQIKEQSLALGFPGSMANCKH